MSKNVFLPILLLFISNTSWCQSSKFEEALAKAHNQRSVRDSALLLAQNAYHIAKTEKEEESLSLAQVYIGAAYNNLSRLDTSIFILKNQIESLDQDLFESGMAHWYLAKGYQHKADYIASKQEYLIAKEIFDRKDSALFVSYCLSGIGICQGMQGNYSEALEWFIEAYDHKLVNGLESESGSDLHNIANVYMRQGSYDKAIDHYRLSLKLKSSENDHSPYTGIGGAYNLQGMTDSALYYYKKSYDISVATNNIRSRMSAGINLSNIYFQKKEHRLAISYLREALESPALQSRTVSTVNVELGKNYFGLGMLDSAEYYLKIGWQEAKPANNRQYLAEASEFLSTVLGEQKRFEEAYEYAGYSMAYADTISRERRNDAITDQRIKLETLKKQHEIDSLNKENLIQQYRVLSLVVGGSGLGIIALLAFINFRSRAKLKQQKLEEEKMALKLELDKKIAQLSAHTLHMIHHKNGLEEIEQHLTDLEGVGKQKIKNVININKAQEKDWENFNTYFSEVHGQFFDILKSHHENLTQSEVRLCALIRMNLANQEMATLLNIEAKSVKMARYRLKKKLNLLEDQDLNKYIRQLEHSPSLLTE